MSATIWYIFVAKMRGYFQKPEILLCRRENVRFPNLIHGNWDVEIVVSDMTIFKAVGSAVIFYLTTIALQNLKIR